MASLKEIKGRIASVGSTLKITSAMKMVASAKLHKAQSAIGNMVPYQKRLLGMLEDLLSAEDFHSAEALHPAEDLPDDSAVSRAGQADPSAGWSVYLNGRQHLRSVALVCFSSNSSLCGGFNANAIREALKVVNEYKAAGIEVTVYSVGRKMAEAMKKAGYPSPADYTSLSASPSYDAAAALGRDLESAFLSGRFDKVEFVYNHFKSTASQPTVRETYLPFSLGPGDSGSADTASDGSYTVADGRGFIVEPSRPALIAQLLPKALMLKVYTVLLDTVTAEHAARTVAMQMATDNGNELLQDLTLEYNKGRQQKITSEILDLEGGVLE
ncbi:F-type H+-transporting ATPase subunit gamma [Bacteroidales bacterium WCE2008]|nr:F-type H+-transporting ATPase subunit gamma [Bacteroidales bacterium WCE2008]